MKTGVFDVLGPVMIGPSSSHTAGACRLGMMARKVLDDDPKEAVIYLHESFQKTRKGHGTELAILGGILGLAPDNEDLKSARRLAHDNGLNFEFKAKELKGEHPNSCQIVLTGQRNDVITITGSSIGGGVISISQIDDFNVAFSGQYHTLLTKHLDRPGVVHKVAEAISSKMINIAFMQMSRNRKGDSASLIVETDEPIPSYIQTELLKDEHISQVRIIEPLA